VARAVLAKEQLVVQVMAVIWVPSGRFSRAVAVPVNVPPVSYTVTVWPAVPAKDTAAFCPGTVVAAVTAAPPTVMV
jgi:hypothetical protein